MKRIYMCLFALLLVWGCGDDSQSGADKVNEAIAEANAASEQYSKTFCTCYADIVTNGNMAQCMRQSAIPMDLKTSCEQKVAECYADDFAIHARCTANAITTYTSCIASCPGTLDNCNALYNQKYSVCASNLPTDLRIAMDACETGQPFTCER